MSKGPEILHGVLSNKNLRIQPPFNPHYDMFGGELRVLACAETGGRTPLGVRQYLYSGLANSATQVLNPIKVVVFFIAFPCGI